jgi:hypothetical protein
MKHDYLKQCKGEGIRDRQGAEHDCGRIFSMIHDILGGDLPGDLGRELEELREKCPFCVDTFLKTLKKTVDVYGRLPDQALSDDDRASLRQEIREGLATIRKEMDDC